MLNTSKPAPIRVHREENKAMRKTTSDGPVYMKFKSYKSKNPSTQRHKSKAPPQQFLSSGENPLSSPAGPTPRFQELHKELKQVKDQQVHLTRLIEKLQSENETLKTHIDTLVSPETHEHLKSQWDESQKRCEILQQKIDRLVAVNETQTDTVHQLNDQIARLQEGQEDLRKQLQVEHDLKQQHDRINENFVRNTESLNETVQNLTNENQTLKEKNTLLIDQTEELNAYIATMNHKIAQITLIEKKLKTYETEAQRRARENKTLNDKNESCTKFVQILENDMQTVKKQNQSIVEQNKQLRKQLSGMKRNLERLRQKYDEINKENKILKEKETRYLLHERFNVGKYAGKLPELSMNEPIRRPANSIATQEQMNNYMRAANNVKTKRTKESDHRYHLLHRAEGIRHNETTAAQINKTTKK